MLAALLIVVFQCCTSDSVEADSGLQDSCALLQQHRSVQQYRVHSNVGCTEVLPVLDTLGVDISGVCQDTLPTGTCDDALRAVGPRPWSSPVIGKLCEAWSKSAGSQRITNGEVVSLLSRSISERAETSGKSLDASLQKKGKEDQPTVPPPPYTTAAPKANTTATKANAKATTIAAKAKATTTAAPAKVATTAAPVKGATTVAAKAKAAPETKAKATTTAATQAKAATTTAAEAKAKATTTAAPAKAATTVAAKATTAAAPAKAATTVAAQAKGATTTAAGAKATTTAAAA